MSEEFVNLTAENLAREHLCCIIRTRVRNEGVEAKRRWLASRLAEGHVFRKLNIKGTVFIEYAPLESAWTPVEGENFMYIYCLWVAGEYAKQGYARSLMEYCLADAKAQGRSGVCMLGAKKQKAWLSDQSFAKHFGFACVDETKNGYELLAVSFNGSAPAFTEAARRCEIESRKLTLYYDLQCPYIPARVAALKEYCAANKIPADFIEIDSLTKAKQLPCAFNNWALFYGGTLQSVNILSPQDVERIIARQA